MDPHLIPGENAALQAQELRERATDLANDEFEAGLLREEFEEALVAEDEGPVVEELLAAEWPALYAKLEHAAPKIAQRIRTKVVTARVETILE